MFKVPYKQQEEFLKLIVDKLPNFSKGAHDAGGNGGFLAEAMQVKYGERIEAIMLTESWYREHTPHFKASLEDGDIENMPADQDVMEDHRAFVLVNGVARIPSMGKITPIIKTVMVIVVLHLLADYAAKNPSAPIEFIPLPSASDLEMNHDSYDGWFSEAGCI
jgi:phage FluMu gp28-like protein